MIEKQLILTRVFSDPLPKSPLDSLYLVGQTVQNESSVLEKAGDIFSDNATKSILMMDAPAVSGYPGRPAWESKLHALNIPPNVIKFTPLADVSMIHTRIEAEAVVDYAKNQRLKTIGICAAPFHQCRAVMTVVSVALETFPELIIFSVPGSPLPWLEKTVHSQGTHSASRLDLIKSEWERIDIYQKKGDLASFDEVLAYFERRDLAVHSVSAGST